MHLVCRLLLEKKKQDDCRVCCLQESPELPAPQRLSVSRAGEGAGRVSEVLGSVALPCRPAPTARSCREVDRHPFAPGVPLDARRIDARLSYADSFVLGSPLPVAM